MTPARVSCPFNNQPNWRTPGRLAAIRTVVLVTAGNMEILALPSCWKVTLRDGGELEAWASSWSVEQGFHPQPLSVCQRQSGLAGGSGRALRVH